MIIRKTPIFPLFDVSGHFHRNSIFFDEEGAERNLNIKVF